MPTSPCPRDMPRLGLLLASPWEGEGIEGAARGRSLVHPLP